MKTVIMKEWDIKYMTERTLDSKEIHTKHTRSKTKCRGGRPSMN